MFMLGADRFAHMTVYMARFHNDDIRKVIKRTAAIIKHIRSFTCPHTGYYMTDGGYYEVSYEKSPPLTELHKELIRQNGPLRINPGKPFIESYFAPYSEKQVANAQETGYDLAYDLFRPHITLTRYAQPERPSIFPDIDLSFDVTKIAVYKADDNGAVYELLEEFVI